MDQNATFTDTSASWMLAESFRLADARRDARVALEAKRPPLPRARMHRAR
jgi:hypothetical protein